MANQSAALKALGALGDPTRRRVFEAVADRPSAVGDLARGLPVTRPAVSQHLKVLEAAGLVTKTADGARHIYRIDPGGIGAMREWLESHWGGALDAFKAFADIEEDPPS